MGLDSLIDNDKEYKSTINYILIKNDVCRTMKEINYSMNKNIDDTIRRNKPLLEDIMKKNPNYQKALQNKKRKEEEERKSKLGKPKFNNKYY